MTSSEALHTLLDGGELDPATEQTLFATLASDEEMRAELRDVLAMRAAVREDLDAFEPSAATTAAVFAAVGVAPTAMAPVAVHSLQRLLLPVLIGTGIMAGVAGYLMFQTRSTLDRAAVVAAVPAVSATAPQAHDPARLPDETTVTPPARIRGPERERSAAIPAGVDEQMPRAGGRQPRATPSSSEGVPAITAVPPRELAPAPDVPARALPPGVAGEPTSVAAEPATPELQHRWDVTLRGFVAAESPMMGLEAERGGVPNLALSAMWNADPRWQIGLEIGRQPFPQEYPDHRSVVEGRHIDEHPRLAWIGASARYRVPALFGTALRPFAQLTLGGTSAGPHERAMIGLTYRVFGSLDILAGIEGTMLEFPRDGAWYTSRTVGLTYGLALAL